MLWDLLPQLDKVVTNEKNNTLSRRIYMDGDLENFFIKQMNQVYVIGGDIYYHGYKNHCVLHLDENQKIVNYNCNCNWCNQKSACGHIGALIYFVSHFDIPSIPCAVKNFDVFIQDQRKSDYEKHMAYIQRKERLEHAKSFLTQNIDIYKAQIQQSIHPALYDMITTLEYQSSPYYGVSLSLSYKIGNNRMYMIKKITAFLENLEQHNYFSYGKHLSFIHSMDVFSESAQKQIEFIRNQSIANPSFTDHLGKQVILSNKNMDAFYDLYAKDEDACSNFILIDKQDSIIEIQIDSHEDCIEFTLLNMPCHIFGLHHGYSFTEEYDQIFINRFVFDEQGVISSFIDSFVDNKLWFSTSDYEEFKKYIWPQVHSFFKVTGDHPLMMDYFDGYIKLYGDMDEKETVYFHLSYEQRDGSIRKGFDEDTLQNTYKQDLVESYIKQYANVIDHDKHTAYMDLNSEETFVFMSEGIPFLNEYCDIYVSNSLQSIGKNTHYSIQAGVKVEHNLLEIDLKSTDIPKSELLDVLRSYRRKKRFHKLKSGKLLYLESNALEDVNTLLLDYQIPLSQVESNTFTLPQNRMFALSESIEDRASMNFQINSSFHKLHDNFYQIDKNAFTLPSAYDAILRSYQKEGYTWLRTLHAYGFNGILADDMGLGKTLQIIVLLESLKLEGNTKPNLVVCPSSLLYNWEDEIHKFSSVLTCCCITGSQANRNLFIQGASQYDVLITSYDYIRRDYETYRDLQFQYVILDEAQYIKNQKTKNAQSVKELRAEHKIALSGTPIENSLAELWSIFDFLMPSYLYTYHHFRTTYETAIVKNHDEKKQTQLKKYVSPFILRRNKKEVLTELPDKTEHTLTLDFNQEEEKLYLANLAQANKELQHLLDHEQMDKIAILALLTRLRQLCCEPQMVYENVSDISSKTNACLELIQDIVDNGQKVLLFSSFTKALDLLAKELEMRNIAYHMLTGKTAKEDRRDFVKAFQEDDTPIFLISLKAGGTGLNLTAAQNVIHFDPWWNVSAQNQATDRAYRIGQNNNVQVFKLIMRNSIEEKIQKMQEQKKNLADAFVEGNDGSIMNMSNDELISLFK